MFRAYQAVLQPTCRQATALAALLESQRELYNGAFAELRGAWRCEGRSISRFEQFRALTGWDHPVLEFEICPGGHADAPRSSVRGVLPVVPPGRDAGLPPVQERRTLGLGHPGHG